MARPASAGVLGWPVGHSLSPLIHRTWAEREGADSVYLKIAVEPGLDALRRAVLGLRAAGFAGVNVTIPHKAQALTLAAEASEAAKAAGAANMLTFRPDGLYADNSDVAGFRAALLAAAGGDSFPTHGLVPPHEVGGKGGLPPRVGTANSRVGMAPPLPPHFMGGNSARARAAVLGAGGAARGVVVALKSLGCDIVVINRTAAKAKAFARDVNVATADWGARDAALQGAGILVNATSLGMSGEPPLDLALDALPADAIVADIVYSPLETKLLRAARARGHRTSDGLSMLMHQAVSGYKAWLGREAVVDADLRARLEAELARRTR